MILAAIATCCSWSLGDLLHDYCPTCWARVTVVWAWMTMQIILLSACFSVFIRFIFCISPKVFRETYCHCVKSVEIEAVEGDQRGPVAVADAV